MIAHLDDFLLRRTKLAWTGQVSHVIIQEVADIIGQDLAWSEGQKGDEINRCLEILTKRHGMKI